MSGVVAALDVGDSVQLSATAVLVDGSSRSVTSTATWKSSNTSIATVSSAGLLQAVAAGSATVTATYQDVVGAQALAVLESSTVGLACGVERWAVKTLSDPIATQVALSQVMQTTVRALNALIAHCSGLPDSRTYPPEFQVYELTGVIVVVRSEDDRDYHVALSDPTDPSITIVTEIPDPQCEGAVRSPYRQTLSDARAQFEAIRGGRALSTLTGTTLRVRGVGFYDFNHGQTGRSTSCIELHPLISIERVQ